MLPKKNRIPRKDFPLPSLKGVRSFSPLFSVVFYPHLSKSQVSVVVSKKTAKTAVARNTLRRRFYELLAPHLGELSRKATIVIYPKLGAEKARFVELKTEIKRVLKEAKLL